MTERIPDKNDRQSPCPTCGCRLYKETGPCAGEDFINAAPQAADTATMDRAMKDETRSPERQAMCPHSGEPAGVAPTEREVQETVAKIFAAVDPAPIVRKLLSVPSAIAPTEADGIEKAATYCEKVLAENHPHAAHLFRHAAINIRAHAHLPLFGDPAVTGAAPVGPSAFSDGGTNNGR